MTRPRTHGPSRDVAAGAHPVLYAIVCGSPVARHVGRFVSMAQGDGWLVCVVATPDGRRFLDVATLVEQTGFPVRTTYRNPGDPDLLPAADALVVAPATVNTVNKWAQGIADTFALGLLIEGYGLGLPTVVMPYTNEAMAAHPAFRESLSRLRGWGVRVVYGADVLAMPKPGTAEAHAGTFPWHLALTALGPARRAGRARPGMHGWSRRRPDPSCAAPPTQTG
jgi:hypothetical protein